MNVSMVRVAGMVLSIVGGLFIGAALCGITHAEEQTLSADTIVVKDVNGICWQIVPRTFMYKGGLMAAQHTVIFEYTPCPKETK